MGLHPELDGRSLDELKRFFEGAPGDEGGASFYMEVADKLGAAGEHAYLRSRGDRDVPRLRALILARSRYDREHARDWLRPFLDGDPAVVAEAIDGLARVGDLESAARVMALSAHDSAWVRGAVVRYAARLTPDESWPFLERAADDPHFIVRENVADELADLEGGRARPLLERLAGDAHEHVRQAAKSALEGLRE